jgi:hypothetical protein
MVPTIEFDEYLFDVSADDVAPNLIKDKIPNMIKDLKSNSYDNNLKKTLL